MRGSPGSGRTRRRSAARTVEIPTSALIMTWALCGTAWAGDPWEAWPELWAFVRLGPQTRLFFDVAYAKGKESPAQALDLAASVDVSFKPILRSVLRQEDWARNRYV